MADEIVTVGRRQYACGLYWENSPSGRVSQAAREAARQPSFQAEFFAVRGGSKNGRVPQFGLSRANSSLRAGLPVLSACLANQQPGSWAGAFHFREGTALVIVRDDLIVPDGDLFFADEGEARDRLLQEMALGDLQRVYAPEMWGISGADTMPISLLLNDRTDIRLRRTTLSTNAKKGIVLSGIVLLALLAGGWWYQKEMESRELAEQERLRQIQLLTQKAQKLLPTGMQPPPTYPPPERVWEKKPKALDVITACRETLARTNLVHAGWTMGAVRCDGNSVSQAWQRVGGFSTPPPKSAVSETGGQASLAVPIDPLTPRGPESLLDPDVITRRYLGQNWTGTISRAPDDPPPPPPPGYQGTWAPPPPPWIKRSFTLSVPVLPWTLPAFIGDVPGVVVNSMALNGTGSNSSWTIDGVIYENRR